MLHLAIQHRPWSTIKETSTSPICVSVANRETESSPEYYKSDIDGLHLCKCCISRKKNYHRSIIKVTSTGLICVSVASRETKISRDYYKSDMDKPHLCECCISRMRKRFSVDEVLRKSCWQELYFVDIALNLAGRHCTLGWFLFRAPKCASKVVDRCGTSLKIEVDDKHVEQ